MRKRTVVGRLYGMKYSRKGHKDRNRHKNRIKRSGRARLVVSLTEALTSPPLEGEPVGTRWRSKKGGGEGGVRGRGGERGSTGWSGEGGEARGGSGEGGGSREGQRRRRKRRGWRRRSNMMEWRRWS